MGEINRRAVILLFLGALPLLAVSGPRLPMAHDSGLAESAEGSTPSATLLGTPPAKVPPPRADQEEWFGAVRQQLLGLGAVYMRLERWNGDCPVYQFRCDLRRSPHSQDQTSIEALSGSPEAATDYVLFAARQWFNQRPAAPQPLRLLPATNASPAQFHH